MPSNKIVIDTKQLKNAASDVARVAATRSSLPVLANVKIASSDGMLAMTCTDLDILSERYVKCEGDIGDELTVPARTLVDLLGTFAAEQTTIEIDNSRKRAIITNGRSRATLTGMVSDDFPKLKFAGKRGYYRLDGALLRRGIAAVLPSVANDDARPILTGVQVKFAAARIVLAASDGFRVSEWHADCDGEAAVFVVHGRFLAEIARTRGDLTLYADKTRLIVDHDGGTISGAHIEGAFPVYEPIFGQREAATNTVTVDRAELVAALRTVKQIAGRDKMRIDLDATDGQLKITAPENETGAGEAIIDATLDGRLAVACNVAYLADIVASLDAEHDATVTVRNAKPTAPIFIDGHDARHALMPMHKG